MRLSFTAALVAILAIGCAESPPADTVSDSGDVQTSIPQESEGGQTADTGSDLTLVTLEVPGMT